MPSLWDDIPPINSQAQERLGYPTQKPEALLERIISASSNEGDVVLDPFCGCGTTVAAAQKLNGRWSADNGIDGQIYFHEGDGTTRQIVLSVKAGKLQASYVRDLRGVVEREQAAIGALLSLDEPTKAMRTEAASAGFYSSPWGKHSELQLLTIEELLAGKPIDAPPRRQTSQTFKQAPKVLAKVAETGDLFGDPQSPERPTRRRRRSN